MNTKIIPLLAISILLITGLAQAVDQPINPAPGYYGTISVNGQAASSGTTIIAKIGNEVRGSITITRSGFYGDDPGPAKLWVTGYQNEIGSKVNFYLNDKAASQISTFTGPGTLNKVDLTFTVPTGGDGGSSGSSSSSSTGGGGGSGISGENASNIELIEKYDLQISKDALTSYRFTHAKNPIMFVNITGNTTSGIITTSIEVLKSTSTLVTVSPGELVYKNANIWVGTSGFATPKNIKEAFIKFRIDNAWMSENNVLAGDIVLMKWNGASWINLQTKVLSKDDTNSYFEGETNAFSPFAIVAKTAAAAKPTVVITAAPTRTPQITATVIPAPQSMSWNWLLYLMVVIIIGAGAYVYIIKKK